MGSRVYNHQEALAKLVREHDAATSDQAVKDILAKRHGLRFMDDKQFANEKTQAYKAEKTAELHAELTRIQNNYAGAAQELETQIMRKTVRAYGGQSLVLQYAKQMKIDADEAQAELVTYAQRKSGVYQPDFLPDRYAALVNRTNLKDQDRTLAENILQEELETAAPQDVQDELKFYQQAAAKHPAILADEFRGSGWALIEQMRGKFKE